ncbi:hypothetical protein Desdi_0347 [Desulfitobacterium dichloroeliminans LMG P-21439]|uniref:Uncharacterized protein n=1 Tax=Desulfitobacterium dichloroeliminans (strain LMG P-21439 / DCA1) TaxID=871963 RepID=L0F211_DESDL|nr:hypothetical protein [Desulfitobacterium dichloroeliminans]AGA67894.1 hypothetical protein Desdi_0347 [Desulfitobacterium dichloroeliminans LMG P-21439]
MKDINPKLNKRSKWKSNLLTAGVYFGVLVLMALFAAFLNQSEGFQSPNAKGKELLAEAPSDWSAGGWEYDLPEGGRFEEQDGVYKNGTLTYKVEEVNAPQLKISKIGYTGYEQIYLERKASADGIIEVNTYVAPHYVRTVDGRSIDFTKLVAPPRISLEEGTLKIEASATDPSLDRQKIVFKNFNDNFTVSQFQPELRNPHESSAMHMGAGGILIRIPSDLEIFDEDASQFSWVIESPSHQ